MNVACTAIACLNNVAREDLALLQVRTYDCTSRWSCCLAVTHMILLRLQSTLGSDKYSVNFLHTMIFLLTQSAETGQSLWLPRHSRGLLGAF